MGVSTTFYGTDESSIVRARPWIGVDLDGTLAHYTGWRGPDVIGEPIPKMVERVKAWLTKGRDVRIFTARYNCPDDPPEIQAQVKAAIEAWCEEHLGQVLPITQTKDYKMIELWDDRAVQVEHNTGERVDGKA